MITNAQIDNLADLKGSSRTQGGVIRGRAVGSTVNASDMEVVAAPLLYVKGKAYLYVTNLNPSIVRLAEMNPSCFVTIEITSSLAPILAKLKRRFEPLADGHYTFYTLDKDSDWEVKGKLDIAVEDDEDIFWHERDGSSVAYILAVGFFCSFLEFSDLQYRAPLLVILDPLLLALFLVLALPALILFHVQFLDQLSLHHELFLSQLLGLILYLKLHLTLLVLLFLHSICLSLLMKFVNTLILRMT